MMSGTNVILLVFLLMGHNKQHKMHWTDPSWIVSKGFAEHCDMVFWTSGFHIATLLSGVTQFEIWMQGRNCVLG